MNANRLDRWIGRDRLRPDEIDGNGFVVDLRRNLGVEIQFGHNFY